MNVTVTEAFTRYQPVIADIKKHRSNEQLLRKKYVIDGRPQKLDVALVQQLRQINKEQAQNNNSAQRNAAQQRANLSGTDEQYSTTMYPQARQEEAHFRKPVGGTAAAAAPQSNLEALIENAELRAELRYLKEKLADRESKLAEVKNEGLGGIDERTDYKFLQRDHATLKTSYDTLQKDYDKIVPQLEELQLKRKDFEFAKEVVEMLDKHKELLYGVIGSINPAIAQRLLGSGTAAPAQLSGIDSSGVATPALEIGNLIVNNFHDEDFVKLRNLINIVYAHREMLDNALYTVQTMLEKKMKSAPKVGAEAAEQFPNAPKI